MTNREETNLKQVQLHRTEGTITVFLSLILLLILSLLFTVIEGARVVTAKVFAERAFSTALDSVLAEYYGPLWEEYHIFGYYPGDASIEANKAQTEALLAEYMSYSFDPGQELEGLFTEPGINLYDIKAAQVKVRDETGLMDYDGDLMFNEAVEYMKYQELGDCLEALLGKLKLLNTPSEVSYIMEEKLKVEDELAEIDRGILELMELLDGIKTSSRGVETASNGSLQTVDPFIKMICYAEVTQENIGINNNNVFDVLKAHYLNPETTFASIAADIDRIEQIMNQLSALREEKMAAENTLAQELKELSSINITNNTADAGSETENDKDESFTSEKQEHTTESSNNDSKVAEDEAAEDKANEKKAQIDSLERQIAATRETISCIENEIREQELLLQEAVSSVQASKDYILQIVTDVVPKIDKAISVIDKILLVTEVAAPLIEKYEELLTSEKEYIEGEIYAGLEDSLSEIKKYVASDDKGYDFEEMKKILKHNRSILVTTQSYLSQADENLAAKQYGQAKEAFQGAGTALSAYQMKGLTLDYSSMVLDKSGQDTPINQLCDLFTQGLTGLVMDEDSISESELTAVDALPTEIAAFDGESRDWLGELSLFLENSKTGQGKTGTNELFNTFFIDTDLLGALGDGINALTEQFLYQEYLQDHFGRYEAENTGTQEISGITQKPSVLEYEQEYLLVGKSSDLDNIASAVSRIILLRTVADFATILGNKTVQAEAKLAATALVGFTGMPMLISLTQALILIMWAFAEALLDTCALMMGKEVPVLKKGITLQFTDLFLISREYLQQKAALVSDSKQISLSYQDYLRIFLLMTDREELIYRSMDLMQENIRLRYQQEDFIIARCLYGFEAEAAYRVDSRFTAFSYVQQYIDDTGCYRFTVKLSNSY